MACTYLFDTILVSAVFVCTYINEILITTCPRKYMQVLYMTREQI